MRVPAFLVAALVVVALNVQQRPLSEIIADLERLVAELKTPASDVIIAEPSNAQATIDAAPVKATVHYRPGLTYPGVRLTKAVRITTLGVPVGLTRMTLEERDRLARVAPTGNVPAFDITGSDVTVDHLDIVGNVDTLINCGHGDSSQSTREQQPQRVTLTRLVIDGTPGAKRGIGAHCRFLTVEANWCGGFRRVGQDTQCIGGWNGEGPITIRNNYLSAAAENVMFGGAAPGIAGLVPADIIIEGNHFWKDPAWRAAGYTQKNLLEFKVGQRAIVRGNLFEHVWQCSSVCQGGYAIVLTPQAQDQPNPNAVVEDVTIEQNEFRNVAAGVNLMGRAQIGQSLQTNRIIIRQNWFRIVKGFNGGASQGWFLFLSREPRDITVEANTIESDSNQIVYLEGPAVHGFRFAQNLVTRSGLYGFSLNGNHRGTQLSTYLPGAVISGNAFGSFPAPLNLPGNFHLPTTVIAPLVIDGYGTGTVQAYGRTR